MLSFGCGKGNLQNFSLCGNGVVDSGETCDDGNTVDSDACTAACQEARCGDGVAYQGVEECDGFDLSGMGCADFGLDGDGLTCDASCNFDTSGCGEALPTRTPTPTPTPTPPETTPTNTPTATPDPCGDGLVTVADCDACPSLGPPSSETCASCLCRIDTAVDCVEDCIPLACSPSASMDTVRVDFIPNPALQATTVTVLLTYRTDIDSLPVGFGVRPRISVPPPDPFLLTTNGLGYGVRVIVARNEGLRAGSLFTAQLDRCEGAVPPTSSDYDCIVEGCSGAGGRIDGCDCSIVLSEP